TGVIEKYPPLRASSRRPKQLSASKRGMQHQSIDPLLETRADEWPSAMSAYSAIDGYGAASFITMSLPMPGGHITCVDTSVPVWHGGRTTHAGCVSLCSSSKFL